MIDVQRLRPVLEAVPLFGRLLAWEWLDFAEAHAALVWAAERAQVRGDPSGWRCELGANLHGHRMLAEGAAHRARHDVRAAVMPLLTPDLPSRAIFQAAVHAAAGRLPPRESRDIATREMAFALRRRR